MPILPKPSNQTTGEPSWRWRRAMAFTLMAFCCFMIAGLGLLPPVPDTRVNETIITSSFWLLGTVFLLYGGFSTAQDIAAILAVRSGRPYAENPVSAPPAPIAPAPAPAGDQIDVVQPPAADLSTPPPGARD